MKNETYNLITMIPFVEMILRKKGDARAMLCSPMLADETFMNPIREYLKIHPDEVITDNILREILANKRPK